MFSSLSNFQVSSSNQPPLFTNLSIELFPSDSNVNTFDELHDASPHASPSSIEDALPTGNALDNGKSSSLPSSVSPIGFDLVEPENEILNPPSSHSTQIKTQSDGSVEHYKAHLVAKGLTREYGIDYEETFASVARLTLVREEIYMQPPPGLEHPPNKVC
ncbi:hypothetical protein SLEP1_g30702 [Rubroshorea leprosula]|uniref:Reverse transcriptase Ty1/copia-type domain-containing protein n=1 Tax=Rubroshorea leprosula TaxID=152421 RepID=A0AAV5K109_9ROSI|nr:hypothetical protein SLEP1_g30702 [Rubroshorea leprosula]